MCETQEGEFKTLDRSRIRCREVLCTRKKPFSVRSANIILEKFYGRAHGSKYKLRNGSRFQAEAFERRSFHHTRMTLGSRYDNCRRDNKRWWRWKARKYVSLLLCIWSGQSKAQSLAPASTGIRGQLLRFGGEASRIMHLRANVTIFKRR